MLYTSQGVIIVCIAICQLTFSMPTKKYKESAHKLQNPSHNSPSDGQVVRVNIDRLSENFNVPQPSPNSMELGKRGRNWGIRSASGTRLPMVRPTGPNIKGFLPNVNSETEECEAVCEYCKDILSMRWAALCLDQCHKQGGGRAYDACYITFHLRDQIH